MIDVTNHELQKSDMKLLQPPAAIVRRMDMPSPPAGIFRLPPREILLAQATPGSSNPQPSLADAKALVTKALNATLPVKDRVAAITNLAKVGPRASSLTPSVKKLLADKEWDVRWQAAMALPAISDKKVEERVKEIVDMINEPLIAIPSKEVLCFGLYACGEAGLDGLRETIVSDVHQVRYHSLLALRDLRDKKHVAIPKDLIAIIKLMRNDQENPNTRVVAQDVLDSNLSQ